MALVIDTGPLYAFYDRSDGDHRRCRQLVEGVRETLVLPAPIIPEFDFLSINRGGLAMPLALLADIDRGVYRIVDLNLDDYARVRQIMQQYADFDIGFVDAAVLAIVERLGEPKLATLDRRHFGVMKPRHVLTLQLLPE